MTELTVNDLHVTLGNNHILKGASLELNRGKIVALLGPSGSGKTTLLRAVAGLEYPSSGTITIADQVVYDGARKVEIPVEKRALGFVFQSYALWPHRTVFENVAYGLKLRKTPEKEIAVLVKEVLGNLGLGDLGDRHPHQLSGGQQQRVALARALVYKPRVILLDEPLSNLDAKLREEARIWLRQLIIELNLSALCVTHDQAEAMAMSDQIVLLQNGVIEQAGTPQEMYEKPRSLFVAEFMGTNNKLLGKIETAVGNMAMLAGDGWALKGILCKPRNSREEAIGVIRTERLAIAEGPGENRIRLPLVTCLYLGNSWEYVFDLKGTHLRGYGALPLPPGEQWVEIPASSLWIF